MSDQGGKCFPPVFGGDKSYERWKIELEAWQIVTTIPSKKQAINVALSFPEGSEVRDRVFSEINIQNLNADDGINKLIQTLDKWYLKDKLTSAYESWSEFDTFRISESSSIESYITEFEKRHKKLSKHGIVIPKCILAFKLLDCADLSHRDKQLALTAVDYSSPDTMFQQMIEALRKFFGSKSIPSSSAAQGGSQAHSGITIKTEPVYVAEEVNFTDRGRYRKKGRGGNSDTMTRGHKPNYRNFVSEQKNPVDSKGNVTRCHICKSEWHYANRCPNREKKVYECGPGDEDEVYLTCGSGSHDEMRNLVGDTFNCAILDSACSSTVCGVDWLQSYLDSLPDDKRVKVHEEKSKATFKFGDGVVVSSLKKVTFPCVLAGFHCKIKSDVVECDIPLLFGKPSMKKAKVKLNVENDCAVILGKNIKLRCTLSGHYCIPLTTEDNYSNVVKQVMFTVGSKSDESEKQICVSKLHKQFGHPTVKRLSQLLKDAGIQDTDYFRFVEEITDNCNICRKYKRTPSRPVVSLPLARDFNEVVAMDLKEWKKGEVYFLHLVDVATRYSRSVVIYDKKGKTIIDKVIEMWIGTGVGSPDKFLADNGGEFANEEFYDMCENLNIRMMHTAAESPFSNGLCERNHAIIDEMVRKIIADQPTCPLHIALAWAVNAKNCLQMVGGYSPYQLVFGRNPKLPNVMNDSLPALEGTTISETLGKHLNALHASRQAFIRAETSEKIRRALRHQVRPTGRTFKNGEFVYFKRENDNEWKGPGTVIGQEGKTVIIKHGSYIVKVHVTRVTEMKYNVSTDIEKGKERLLEEVRNRSNISDVNTSNNDVTGTVHGVNDSEEDESTSDETEIIEDKDSGQDSISIRNVNIPNVGQRVKYLPVDSDEWKVATILSRAGKATGMYKNWLNIQDVGCAPKSIDWDLGVRQWQNESSPPQEENDEPVTLDTNEVFLSSIRQNDDDVLRAKQRELENWQKFKVYEVVPDRGQKSLSVRWVCTEKKVNGVQQVRARLVARGFEESHQIRTDSPTGGKEVLRIFLSLMASKNWKCNSIDIKAAFLQGDNFEREVCLRPPKEADCSERVLWKLNKCVYGLNDAARVWYFTVKTLLVKLGCTQLKADPAGFYWYQDGELSGVFLMHVDDFIWGGTQAFRDNVISKIKSEFQIGMETSGVFKYIGLEVRQNDSGITLSQNQYLKIVEPVPVNVTRACHKMEDCNATEQENLRCLVGQIGWLSINTRPDVSYDVLELSCILNHPKVDNMIQANKCLRKAEMVDCSLKFPHLGDLNKIKLVAFSDASFASLPDGYSSAEGFIIFLVGEDGKSCPLAWGAKKIRRVVKSTLAAETLAASDAVDMCYYLGSVLSEILFQEQEKNVIPIYCYVDNQSLVENVHSMKNVSEKRLRLDLATLKQLIQEGFVNMSWVRSELQLSDCLTKKGVNTFKLLSILQKGNLKDLDM